MALGSWINPIVLLSGRSTRYCDIIFTYNLVAFVYNVTIILNRWLTFFMAFKRCRTLYSTSYALKVVGKNSRKNWQNCFVYGFLVGLAQGLMIASIRCVLGRFGYKFEAYIFLMIHPFVFTLSTLSCTIAMITKTVFCNDGMDSNPAATKNFLNSIVAVALVYAVTHSAGLIYLILAAMDRANTPYANKVRKVVNCINMTANFLIYLCFSRQFRVTLKRMLWSMG